MNDKELYTKKGVFSLEYDKETLRDMVLELQSNWNSLREWLEKEYKKYDIGIKTYGQAQVEETLNKMNELEGIENNEKNN